MHTVDDPASRRVGDDSAETPDSRRQHFVLDKFEDGRRFGTVINTPASRLGMRSGIDSQSVFAIDNEALRIRPLLEPGWGKACISYTVCPEEPGVAFSVYILNGHNTSQVENLPDTIWRRLNQWLYGSQSRRVRYRLIALLRSGRVLRTLRQFVWWWHLRKSRAGLRRLDENLAVGWFPGHFQLDPVGVGHGFVMHATGPENGELWANVCGRPMRLIRGVMNIPLHLVVVLRPRGAAYYASSVPASARLPAPPKMRLLAIDVSECAESLLPLITQSTLGQIGFRLDTRVYAASVALLPAMRVWHGTAHVADTMTGNGRFESAPAAAGGDWLVVSGALKRLESGTTATGSHGGGMAIIDPRSPSSVIHAMVTCPSLDDTAELVFRFDSESDFFSIQLTHSACQLIESGSTCTDSISLPNTDSTMRSVQIIDWGCRIECHIDGRLVLEKAMRDPPSGTGVGLRIRSPGCTSRIVDFEAHPLECDHFSSEQDMELDLSTDEAPIITEEFDGDPISLDGKLTKQGIATWHRIMGDGHIDIAGDSTAQVRASPDQPNPGRTAFALDWSHPDFVELEMEITPPGTDRGQGETSRVGFLIWQDSDNYAMFNVWNSDGYDGASVSSFFTIDGFEDLYDAIWCNVGDRIWYGRPVRLRLACDGWQYLIYLDDEPVLFRKFRDIYPKMDKLQIHKIGIAVNWEWGDDTGSSLRRFTAKARDANPNSE